MMNNESTCHQPNPLTVDSLSYKELQVLAMSLSLPGKMKQGVLVEAIKARQNQNEQAVAMILEANRQRRILRREQQQRSQQQQLLKLKNEGGDINKRTKCLTRSKMKRSASEMDMDPAYIINEETFKRSKLAAALIQSRQQSRGPTSFSFSSLTTGPTSLTIRKEHQYQAVMGGCSTWDQQQQQQPTVSDSVVGLPSQSLPTMMQQKALPDLSKELSILPLLSDCSNSGGSGVNSTNNEDLCCSVGSISATSSSSWQSGGSGDNHHSLPLSSFESCDSGWIGADDSYDLNTWKNLQNIKLSNNNGLENLAPPLQTPTNSYSAYFDTTTATPASDMFINNSDIYSADDFISNNNSSTDSNYNTDFQHLNSLESSNCFQDIAIKPDPCSSSSTWCESFIQQSQSFQQTQQFQQSSMQNGNGSNSVCSTMSSESRVTSNDCCSDFDCYQLGGPFFRIQRPGNPTSVFVPSGRSLTLSTFCNMLPRVASYVQ